MTPPAELTPNMADLPRIAWLLDRAMTQHGTAGRWWAWPVRVARWPFNVAAVAAAAGRGHLLWLTQVNPELAKTRAILMFRDTNAGIFERLRGWLAATAVMAAYLMLLGLTSYALLAVTGTSLAAGVFLTFCLVAPLPLFWQLALRRGRLGAALHLSDPETGLPSIQDDRLMIDRFESWPADGHTEQRLWWAALGHRRKQTVVVAPSPQRVADLTKLGFRSLPWEPLVLTLAPSPSSTETMTFSVPAEDEPTVPNRI
ncbi:MAG: hypothetical protein K0U64_10650 [Actinomycetia bacterium]|nr:hypothetical protein [Actinomycetes bacterium]